MAEKLGDTQLGTAIDATPDGVSFEMESVPVTRTINEWAEHMWYNNIVNFGFREQESLLSGLNGAVQGISKILFSGWPVALGIVIFLAAIRVWRYLRSLLHNRRRGRDYPAEKRRRAIAEAGHFYGQMMRGLTRFQLARRASQTPMEFLHDAEAAELSIIDDVRMITHSFCNVRYGETPLTDELRSQITAALGRIKKGK